MENQTQKTTPAEFEAPRHWLGPEQLTSDYWSDEKSQERRGQEFAEKPVEWLEQMDKAAQGGMARRDFLTVMGASMAMASFSCARRPVHKIIPYVVQPEQVTPGVSTWYASTCRDDEALSGILIKTREGRPIKLEGNPDDPFSGGTLGARAQASILNLYDPDRLKTPVSRDRASGARQETDWASVDGAILPRLKAAAGRVRVLTGAAQSPSTEKLLREFTSAMGGSAVQYEALALDDVSEGQAKSYGAAQIPGYRFDAAELVVSFGADFLGAWPRAELYSRDWAKRRKLDSRNAKQAELSKLIVVESAMTLTGANADERFSVRAGDEFKVAMAVLQSLVASGRASGAALTPAAREALASYMPEAVASDVGLRGGAQTIRDLAAALEGARGKAIVIAGGTLAKSKDAPALQAAVNFINSVLGNEGATIDGGDRGQAAAPAYDGLARLVAEMNEGKVGALVIHRANPAFTAPFSGFTEALKKVPLVISITDREDETARLADFTLPDHHYLENWGDVSPAVGVMTLQQPALEPIHSSRAFEDTLLVWMGRTGKTWHAYLKDAWRDSVYRAVGGGDFETFWENSLRVGVVRTRPAGSASARATRGDALEGLPKFAAAQAGVVRLALHQSQSIGDGRFANNPWLQELPDPVTTVTWDNYLAIPQALADKLHLKNDDVVEVKASGATGEVKAELPVRVQPGMHPESVMAFVGYGRRFAGKVGNGAGVDLYPFVTAVNGRTVFAGMPVQLRKTGRFYNLAATQWHFASENRPIINDITLDEFRSDPRTANHTKPHLREPTPSLWPKHEYKGHRWGMSIDLNSCTGCSACMIACQAENNIPVVGRDRVRVSRQMHWIRIDRYYSGSVENPGVVFQPMLCQHCENAPCETVCPVIATLHDDEGLNVQVYNRCVGTRYCQNNCPYKVRRFNFFDHWVAYEGTMNMAWNPDVTVRTRGIMEKCTFCVQRIRDAKDKAKDAGKKVTDGGFKTACQQTCPTDAIRFGDMNDQKSLVSEWNADARMFHVLEGLNTKPSISYLTKVRNVAAKAHGDAHGDSHGH